MKLIEKLLRKFRISRGLLYHYTSEEVASSICDGEFWLTRADCFEDKSEIEYGEKLLRQVANSLLSLSEQQLFIKLLSDAKTSLSLTYVMSLSQDLGNPHLLETYGRAIVAFEEHFPISFRHTEMHSIPIDNGGFQAHFLENLYEFFEGLVIYDEEEQLQISSDICEAHKKFLNAKCIHKTDYWHFVEIVKRCLILFRQNSYFPEREYRLSISYLDATPNTFEHTKNDGRIFIEAQFARNLVKLHT